MFANKQFNAVLALVFTISFVFSVYALLEPDVLRIEKAPLLFGQYSVSFGLYESCLTKPGYKSCAAFPDTSNDKCKLPFPDQHYNGELTFCQAWLTSRYLQLGAAAFGGLSLLGWLSMLIFGLSAEYLLSWCALLHAGFQIGTMSIMTKLRQDPLFYFGGAYGTSFMAITASWILSLVVLCMFGAGMYFTSRTFYYAPIPSPPTS
ncbi:hypothetical protein EDD86DRAFT_192972 [Gorgonomyces haynaldii]|nr:hypothetical protein EDD86DRAFT_192972 [Gorgonomyces haynaldii]